LTLKLGIAATLVLTLLGCASKPPERVPDRVILLPSETGKPSGVIVKTKDAEVVLSTPYAGAEIRGASVARSASTAEEVDQRYGGLLSAQARQPKVFTMFFVLATDEFAGFESRLRRGAEGSRIVVRSGGRGHRTHRSHGQR